MRSSVEGMRTDHSGNFVPSQFDLPSGLRRRHRRGCLHTRGGFRALPGLRPGAGPLKSRLAWSALAAAVLLLAGLLRFPNLADNPGWHSDEGSLLAAAQSLNRGEWNYLGIGGSNLVSGRQPLFVWLLSAALRIAGGGIGTLRAITAALGLLTTTALILVPARPSGRTLGLLAGTVYAVLPFTVLYNRLGFSYNLLALLTPLIAYGLYRHLETGRPLPLAAACLLAGLGAVSDLWALAYFPACLAAAWIRNRRSGLIGTAALLLPAAAYALVMLGRDAGFFLFDLGFIFTRVRFSLLDQVGLVLTNYGLLLSEEPWIVLGLAGLFLLDDRRLRGVLLGFLALTFVFAARSVALVGLGGYQLLPLAPVLAIGLAGFILAAWRFLHLKASGWLQAFGSLRQVRLKTTRLLAHGLPLILIGSPFLLTTVRQVAALDSRLPSELDGVLIYPANARLSAAYVNARTDFADLVIASPALAWTVDANVTDFQVSLAYEGRTTRHFPPDIPQTRFTFDPRLSQSRYVIVDRIWDNWAAANVPDMDLILRPLASWPLAAEFGEFRIYRNPDVP